MLPDKKHSGCLYLVATPIGNLGDLSSRAAESLKDAHVIACEDTRVTSKLLKSIDLVRPMVSYREENERDKSEKLALEIENGRRIALVSDAGYPCINDPGFRLVRECRKRSLKIIPVPGPNAALTALSASGLPTHQFVYLGFLPKKSSQIKKTLESWKEFGGSLVIYESKYKVDQTLELISETLGSERYLCLARELTKKHEEMIVGPVREILQSRDGSNGKGEFTLVIAPEGYSFDREK